MAGSAQMSPPNSPCPDSILVDLTQMYQPCGLSGQCPARRLKCLQSRLNSPLAGIRCNTSAIWLPVGGSLLGIRRSLIKKKHLSQTFLEPLNLLQAKINQSMACWPGPQDRNNIMGKALRKGRYLFTCPTTGTEKQITYGGVLPPWAPSNRPRHSWSRRSFTSAQSCAAPRCAYRGSMLGDSPQLTRPLR